MTQHSTYHCQYYASICCHDLDADQYLTVLAEAVRTRLTANGAAVSRLALHSEKEGQRCSELPVTLEAAAAMEPEALAEAVQEVILDVSGRFNLSVFFFRKDGSRPGEEAEPECCCPGEEVKQDCCCSCSCNEEK